MNGSGRGFASTSACGPVNQGELDSETHPTTSTPLRGMQGLFPVPDEIVKLGL